MALLECDHLDAGYGGSTVVQNVRLRVEPGSITGIIGPNGAGKSTVLKAIMGLLARTEGTIRFRDESIGALRADARIRAGLGYVAQTRSHFPRLTVMENLRLGGWVVRNKDVFAERLKRVFERFPVLADRRNSVAELLSGGQLRMLEIGRFLMAEPSLVLLDEPSIGLAPPLVDAVYVTIEELRSEGITFLIVEQNVRKLLQVADYVYVLEMGRNRFEGISDDFVGQAQLAGLYLGSVIEASPEPERGSEGSDG